MEAGPPCSSGGGSGPPAPPPAAFAGLGLPEPGPGLRNRSRRGPASLAPTARGGRWAARQWVWRALASCGPGPSVRAWVQSSHRAPAGCAERAGWHGSTPSTLAEPRARPCLCRGPRSGLSRPQVPAAPGACSPDGQRRVARPGRHLSIRLLGPRLDGAPRREHSAGPRARAQCCALGGLGEPSGFPPVFPEHSQTTAKPRGPHEHPSTGVRPDPVTRVLPWLLRDVSVRPSPTHPSFLTFLTHFKANCKHLYPSLSALRCACNQAEFISGFEPRRSVRGVAWCWSRQGEVSAGARGSRPRAGLQCAREGRPTAASDISNSVTFLEMEWEENCWVPRERKARGALEAVPARPRHRQAVPRPHTLPFPDSGGAGGQPAASLCPRWPQALPTQTASAPQGQGQTWQS